MLQRAVSVLTCLFLAHSSLAQTRDRDAEAPSLSAKQIEQIRKNPRAAIETKVKLLYAANSSGVLDAQVLETIRQRTLARRRAEHYGMVLTFDLNDDLSLQASEIDAAARHLGFGTDPTKLAAVEKYDLDKDGALSHDEILKVATELAEAAPQTAYGNMRRLFAFDDDGDGAVTPAEVGAVIRRLAELTPADMVRRTAATRDQAARRKRRALLAKCAFPAPSDEALILLLSGHRGAGLSTATVAGQDGVTTVASLHIEPGERPIYLVALSQAGLIWNIDGAVERIESFVMSAKRRASGVVGLDREVVRFMPDEACFPSPFSDAGSGAALLARGEMSVFLDREPNSIIARGLLGEISLPSGAHTDLRRDPAHRGSSIKLNGVDYILTETKAIRVEGPRAATPERRLEILRQRLRGGFPAGVVAIDPARVIAASRVERYQVLPAEAGLLQLARRGAIEITPEGHFRIVKPIPRFPAGLLGAAKSRLILAEGVPMPEGSTRFSTLILEASGECVSKFGCP